MTDTPRKDDPFWDIKRKQPNGIIRRVVWEDGEIIEVYVEFYDDSFSFYSIEDVEGNYTMLYGGGWLIQ